MLRPLITCKDLIEQVVKPVTVRVLGDLLESFPYTRTPHCYLDDARVTGPARVALRDDLRQLTVPSRPIALFAIENATVFGQGSVLIADRHLLHDSAAEFINHGLVPDGGIERDGVFTAAYRDDATRIAGRTLLVKRPWYRNYGHWLIDLLPLLPLVRNGGVCLDTIVYGNVPNGNIREMMDKAAKHFFPDAAVAHVDDATVLSCETLLFVQPVHVPPLFKHPGAVEAAADALRQLYPDRSTSRGKRFYISRARSTLRRVVNEDALVELLGKHGFETVFPEELTSAEQIALFENAEHVVSVKGAALTNALVGRKDVRILVLSPANFVDSFFWDLCTQRGQRYAEIFCEPTTLDPAAHVASVDIRADLTSVARYLRAVHA